MFSAAIFDMDGLLIDSERTIMETWLRVTSQLGRPLTQTEYVPVIGRGAKDSAALLRQHLGDALYDRALVEVQHQLASAPPEDMFPPKPGAHAVLVELQRLNIPRAVVSSTATHEVKRRLAATGLLSHFTLIIGGDRVNNAKPDPAIYRLATETLSVDASECLAFEDSDNGVSAAHGASVKVILVPDLKAPEPATITKTFEVLTSLTDALPRISTWFSRY